jgi:hypothetical protein
MRILLILPLAALIGCDELLMKRPDPGNHYVRDSFECPCTDCKCNHCTHAERGARCYCNTGGCSCGSRGQCKCPHCTGIKGAHACDCSK